MKYLSRFVVCFVALGGSVSAATLDLSFSGVVVSSEDTGSSFTPDPVGVQRGDTVTGVISYGTEPQIEPNSALSNAEGSRAVYTDVIALNPTVSLSFGDTSIQFTPIDGGGNINQLGISDDQEFSFGTETLLSDSFGIVFSPPNNSSANGERFGFGLTKTTTSPEIPSLTSSISIPTKPEDIDFSAGTGASASYSLAENGIYDYRFELLIDTQNLAISMNVPPVEEPAPSTTEKAVVAIDFSNSSGLSLETAIAPYSDNEYVYMSSGTSEIAFVSDQDLLISEVQDIFDRSNVAIEVVDAALINDDVDSLVTVLLMPNDIPDSLGEAFDIKSSEYEGLGYLISGGDRFDLDKDGRVAIFKDENDVSREFLASIIAHEAGHGFGLHHVDDENTSAEVMDYSFQPDVGEVFSDVPLSTVIFEGEPGDIRFPIGDLPFPTTAFRGDINSQYHLRAYALGENQTYLREDEGLVPGSYDLMSEEPDLSQWLFDFGENTNDLAWYVSEHGHDRAFSSLNMLYSLDHFFEEGQLGLLLPDNAEFQIFGLDANDSIIDFVLAPLGTSVFGDDLKIGDLSNDLGLFDFRSGSAELFDTVSVQRGLSVVYGDPASVAPVPLSGSLANYLLILLAGCLARKWRGLSITLGDMKLGRTLSKSLQS